MKFSEGKARKEDIVAHVLQIYKEKFRYLRDHFDIMDQSIASILHLQANVISPSLDRSAHHKETENLSRPMVKRKNDPGAYADSPAPKHFKSSFRDETWQSERNNPNIAPLGSIQLPITRGAPSTSEVGSSLTDRLLALSGTFRSAPSQHYEPPFHLRPPVDIPHIAPPTVNKWYICSRWCVITDYDLFFHFCLASSTENHLSCSTGFSRS